MLWLSIRFIAHIPNTPARVRTLTRQLQRSRIIGLTERERKTKPVYIHTVIQTRGSAKQIGARVQTHTHIHGLIRRRRAVAGGEGRYSALCERLALSWPDPRLDSKLPPRAADAVEWLITTWRYLALWPWCKGSRGGAAAGGRESCEISEGWVICECWLVGWGVRKWEANAYLKNVMWIGNCAYLGIKRMITFFKSDLYLVCN